MAGVARVFRKWPRFHPNPFIPVAPQKCPDYFGNIFVTRAFSRKYLKEKCLSDINAHISANYFVNQGVIPKLSSKLSRVQTTSLRALQA